MAPTALNVTVGDPNMNAYVTVAVADQYQADRPVPDQSWVTAGPDQKVAAILWATKMLDALYVWSGYVAVTNQALLWPRQGLMKRDNWTPLPYTSIPVELQYATAEFARQLIAADRISDSDIESQRISSVKAGSVAVTFNVGVTAKPLPDAVFYLLPSEWGYPRSRSTGVRELERA